MNQDKRFLNAYIDHIATVDGRDKGNVTLDLLLNSNLMNM
jgi:hypothetical protein